jgi:hypothetical protein
VTESDWATSTDVTGMLGFLRDRCGSDRKLRLLAVACCRSVSDVLARFPDPLAFIEVNEQVADGLDSPADVEGAATRAHIELSVRRWFDDGALALAGDMVHALWPVPRVEHALSGAEEVAGYRAVETLLAKSARERSFRWWRRGPKVSKAEGRAAWDCAVAAKRSELGALLRCIFGTGPSRPVPFDPSWRTDAVVALARQQYEAREFSAMPVMADALEDAGCAVEDILNHCRGPEPHVRGCHVVDFVLGRS